MNPPAPFLRYGLAFVGLCVVLGGLAISNDSFWIDECVAGMAVQQPTLADCWHRMRTGPEVQLPLFMFYLWFYAQAFGTGEWVLRAAGLPGLVAGIVVFAAGTRGLFRSALLPAGLAAFSAFSWYYLNEAKVYSIQLGFTLALTGAGAALMQSLQEGQPSRTWWRMFLVSLWLLCGTSVLAMFWTFFLLVAFTLLLPAAHRRTLLRLDPRSLILCTCGLLFWTGYYTWTMTLDAKPTAIGTTTPQTMAFVFYELLGFAAWGPARNELRTYGVHALKPYFLPLFVFGVLVAQVSIAGLKEIWSRFGGRRVILVAVIVLLPFALLCLYGMAVRFRVLGRHATPLLPLLLLVLGFGLVRLMEARGTWPKFIVVAFALAWISSSLLIRFAPRHVKDDFRGAVAIAKAASAAGKNVWWNADGTSAIYYQLPTNIPMVMNTSTQQLQSLATPDLVIVSKPDTYDIHGSVRNYLAEHGYRTNRQLSVFTFWQKPE